MARAIRLGRGGGADSRAAPAGSPAGATLRHRRPMRACRCSTRRARGRDRRRALRRLGGGLERATIRTRSPALCAEDVHYEDPLTPEPLEGCRGARPPRRAAVGRVPGRPPGAHRRAPQRRPLRGAPAKLLATHKAALEGLPATNRFIVVHCIFYCELERRAAAARAGVLRPVRRRDPARGPAGPRDARREGAADAARVRAAAPAGAREAAHTWAVALGVSWRLREPLGGACASAAMASAVGGRARRWRPRATARWRTVAAGRVCPGDVRESRGRICPVIGIAANGAVRAIIAGMSPRRVVIVPFRGLSRRWT